MKKRILCTALAALCLTLAACGPITPTTTPAPTTLPPTTQAPTTLPPTTEAPTTLPPTTEAPRIGWYEEDGKKYYYDENSQMLTGWLAIDDQWYYMEADGAMAVGKTEVEGETLYFGSDGIQILLVNPWNFLPEDYDPEIVDV